MFLLVLYALWLNLCGLCLTLPLRCRSAPAHKASAMVSMAAVCLLCTSIWHCGSDLARSLASFAVGTILAVATVTFWQPAKRWIWQAGFRRLTSLCVPETQRKQASSPRICRCARKGKQRAHAISARQRKAMWQHGDRTPLPRSARLSLSSSHFHFMREVWAIEAHER